MVNAGFRHLLKIMSRCYDSALRQERMVAELLQTHDMKFLGSRGLGQWLLFCTRTELYGTFANREPMVWAMCCQRLVDHISLESLQAGR